jgi:hypothetical protein
MFLLALSSIFFLINQNQFNAFAVFTVERNDDNEDPDSAVAKIILNKIKYRSDKFSDYISGQIMNVGNGTAESIQVIFTYYDKTGNVIGSDYTYANQDSLKPGQKSPFNQMVDEEIGDDMEAYETSLSWENSDGSEEYAENVQLEDESNYRLNSGDISKVLTEEEIEKLGLFER